MTRRKFYQPEKDKPAQPKPFVCCACGDKAGHGEGYDIKRGIVGTWYCTPCFEKRVRG